jgi:glycosyltransferase involved in cell wall biosynthesis
VYVKVSAVIPTYNRRKYVGRAIESVLSQTLPVGEILVIDDGSTDGTAENLQAAFGERLRIIRQENCGVSAARRLGVLEAQGEWIAFLDSDDEWTPDRNRVLREAIGRVPADVAWIFGDVLEIRDESTATLFQMHGLKLSEGGRVFDESLGVQFPFQFGMLQASVIRREPLKQLNCFLENLKHSEDVLAGFQIACRYRFAAVNEVVTKLYRTCDLSDSSLVMNPTVRLDYYRARVEAFSLAARSGRGKSWGYLHAEAVRGLCKELSKEGEGARRLALQQFRHGVSGKSISFLCAAMLGSFGMRIWSGVGATGRVIEAVFGSFSPTHSTSE